METTTPPPGTVGIRPKPGTIFAIRGPQSLLGSDRNREPVYYGLAVADDGECIWYREISPDGRGGLPVGVAREASTTGRAVAA